MGWIEETIRNIRDLTMLGQDWDDENSPPIDRDIMNRAEEFVMKISEVLDEKDISVGNVYPISGGAMSVSWSDNKRTISLDFYETDKIIFIVGNHDNNECDAHSVTDGDIGIIAMFVESIKKDG